MLMFEFSYSGVHHKKNNCESNQVISKVQQVISVATKAGQLYPRNLMLTVASVIKKQKIRKVRRRRKNLTNDTTERNI